VRKEYEDNIDVDSRETRSENMNRILSDSGYGQMVAFFVALVAFLESVC
jgi:hypothetical protein